MKIIANSPDKTRYVVVTGKRSGFQDQTLEVGKIFNSTTQHYSPEMALSAILMRNAGEWEEYTGPQDLFETMEWPES